jgi:hypothetical protein
VRVPPWRVLELALEQIQVLISAFSLAANAANVAKIATMG